MSACLNAIISSLELDAEIIQAQLQQKEFAGEFLLLAQTQSTNLLARDWLAQHPASGADGLFGQIVVAVVANEQTQGYGRRGRTWRSPADVNLYISVAFSVQPGLEPSSYSLIGTVVLARCLARHLPSAEPLNVKWPNDIQYQGKKLAGILIETSYGQDGRLYAIMGAGINVNMTECEAVDQPWTSLKLIHGRALSRAEILVDVLLEWQQALLSIPTTGLAPFTSDWSERDARIGQLVYVRLSAQKKEFSAHYQGIDSEGRLILQTDAGLQYFQHTQIADLNWSDA